MVRSGNRRGVKGSFLEGKWVWLVPAVALVAVVVLIVWPPAPEDRYKPLLGRWNRVGDDYALEVERVAPDGTVEAQYFNPMPIKIGKARAEEKAGTLKLVVELRDDSYPGSTYTLIYDAQTNMLRGTYYEANYQQTFDVEFAR